MTRAYIHLPPVPVEAGQKECPRECDSCRSDTGANWSEVYVCRAHEVVLDGGRSGCSGDRPLRCSACHASERPEPEPRVELCLTTERDAARAEVARLEAERDALRQHVHTVRCAFCGEEFPVGADQMPMSGLVAAVVTEHLLSCPAHPMRGLEAERDALREQLAAMQPHPAAARAAKVLRRILHDTAGDGECRYCEGGTADMGGSHFTGCPASGLISDLERLTVPPAAARRDLHRMTKSVCFREGE